MQKAASLAADAEEKEQRGQFAQAKAEHSEAARLFRLSAASVQDESHQQQLRALARHHDARAKWCETAEAAKVRIQKKKKKKKKFKALFVQELDKARRASGEPKSGTPQVLVHHSESPPAVTGFKPIPNSSNSNNSNAQQQPTSWDFWKPLEHMMERLFPKDLFGASPPKQQQHPTTISPVRHSRNLFDSDEANDNNAMMESFMVVADYEPPDPDHDSSERKPVLRLTKKQSSVLDSVMHGKLLLEDDNAELRQLVEKL